MPDCYGASASWLARWAQRAAATLAVPSQMPAPAARCAPNAQPHSLAARCESERWLLEGWLLERWLLER
jgi:hypothetical protein